MHYLSNKELHLELLDPADPTDRARQGTRFSHGGYIWQVRERNGDSLLAGPEWPKPDPAPYNGQGLPESFSIDVDPAYHAALNGEEPLLLAAGGAKLDDQGKPRLAKPCYWHCNRTDESIEYYSTQSTGYLSLMLMRRVRVMNRTITSSSWLANTGLVPFSLCWFAHPFLPLSNGLFYGKIAPGYSIKENDAFSID